jgi:hypothetical protein
MVTKSIKDHIHMETNIANVHRRNAATKTQEAKFLIFPRIQYDHRILYIKINLGNNKSIQSMNI